MLSKPWLNITILASLNKSRLPKVSLHVSKPCPDSVPLKIWKVASKSCQQNISRVSWLQYFSSVILFVEEEGEGEGVEGWLFLVCGDRFSGLRSCQMSLARVGDENRLWFVNVRMTLLYYHLFYGVYIIFCVYFSTCDSFFCFISIILFFFVCFFHPPASTD